MATKLRTDSNNVCLLTFRVTLECGLFICTCRSSRWKKFTLSWKVSEPPEEQEDPSWLQPHSKTPVQAVSPPSTSDARVAAVAAIPIRIPVQSYLCSYGESGWKWLPECSSPYSWAPRVAECHHLPLVWGAYEQGQGRGMKTNKGEKNKVLISKTLKSSKKLSISLTLVPTNKQVKPAFSMWVPTRSVSPFFHLSALQPNYILSYWSHRDCL